MREIRGFKNCCETRRGPARFVGGCLYPLCGGELLGLGVGFVVGPPGLLGGPLLALAVWLGLKAFCCVPQRCVGPIKVKLCPNGQKGALVVVGRPWVEKDGIVVAGLRNEKF